MPQLGESVAEGTIGKWLKQPGDKVAKYEPLVEVITDKVNAEVPSPFEGILKEILVEEGATVPNNAEIAIIETAEDAASGGTTDAQPAKAAAVSPDDKGAPSAVSAEATGPAASSEPASPTPAVAAPSFTPADGPAGSDERPERAAATAAAAPTAVAAEPSDVPGNPDARMTPAVRRLLREHGVTAAQIVGSGGGGRITREDVTNYVESQRTGQSVGGQAVGGAPAPAAPAPAPSAASSNGSGAAASSTAPAPLV
ncbi:MAG TPA: biotin/lipoyl-containing protein, partial [Candidatus Limnocylindrales bacterium]